MTNNMKMSFKAHARLKDIVGRGLIISDPIAIIELIKNSKDAQSKSVHIEFRQNKKTGKTELIISDTGVGMSLDDISNKWLNIAYSEKRGSKPTQGAYAGNKGIGRFSCDRLGKSLVLYSKKNGHDGVKLEIDWTKFEVDALDQDIGQIENSVSTPSEAELQAEMHPNATSGTVLIIRNLRSDWNYDKIKSLRKELERFIIDPEKKFAVYLKHFEYPKNHEFSGRVENKIFEELDFRSSSIKVSTIDNGSKLLFELRHDGDYIFKSTEVNIYHEIKSATIELFFLNQPAKAFFKRRTGYRSIDYGSIFLFLNGFRVLPYGSPGDDWLGIQKRQAQGQRRFFGTRDIVGIVQLDDAGDHFTPVSSREGLIQNEAYDQLTSDTKSVPHPSGNATAYGLFHKAMRKLEKFVIDGLDWDRIDRTIGDDNDDELIAGNYKYLAGEKPILEALDSVIRIRSAEEDIIDIDINVKYLSSLAVNESDDYNDFVGSLQEKLQGTPLQKISASERKDLSKFISRQARELAKKDQTNAALEFKVSNTVQALQVEERRRIFAELESSTDTTKVLQLHHQIGLISGSLLKRIGRIARKYRSSPDAYTKEELFDALEMSLFDIEKIQSVSKMATKAGFDVSTNRVHTDIIQFIAEYLESFSDVTSGWGIKATFVNARDLAIHVTFRPIEITMLVDNLLDNAGKSGARNVCFDVMGTINGAIISVIDDGKGLSDRFSPDDLFLKGITSTSGSGIGLSHAKQIVEEIGGTISIENRKGTNGAVVRIEIKK